MKIHLGKYLKNGKRTEKIQIDPWDTYNADTDLAKIIHAILVEYKKETDIHPVNMTEDEWQMTLSYMIESFRRHATGDIEKDCVPDNPELTKANMRETQLGLDLFATHFGNLWI